MKRKGRSPAEEKREACGIWLDTSALKKRKMQTLIPKPTLNMQNRPVLYPALEKVPLPFTKQTTISTFFRTPPVGEKKGNTDTGLSSDATSSESDCNLQGRESLEGEGSQLPASSLPLLWDFRLIPSYAHQTSAQSNCRWMERAKGEKSTTEYDNLGSPQHLEANGVIEHTAVSRSPLINKNGGWRTSSALYSQTSQSPKALRRGQSCSSCNKRHLRDSSDSENMDPQLERGATAVKGFDQNITGIPSETVMALCLPDKGSEYSQLGCASPLFSQDSEGYRVLSHHSSGERGNLYLLKQQPLGDKSNQRTSPAYRDSLETCFLPESGPQRPAGAEIRLKSCYDLLFTEDSEGNRVIKH